MKSKEQIIKHLQEVGYSSKQRVKISAYLLGKGIEIDTKDMLKGVNKFEDFLEWEKNIKKMTEKTANHLINILGDINKELDKIFKTIPKYKVGDWVRVIDDGEIYADYDTKFKKLNFKNTTYNDCKINTIGQIFAITKYEREDIFLYAVRHKDGEVLINEDGIEPYYPKEGEFFVAEMKDNEKWIGHKGYINDMENHILYINYCICLDTDSVFSNLFLCDKTELESLRPATEEEIQILKDKVKEKYNQEYKSEEWVDIKKSDKELFKEWKKDNVSTIQRLLLCSINPSYIEKKLIAYTELYLFSQWVNQFYKDEESITFIFIHNNCVYTAKSIGHKKLGQIEFNSEAAAKRAIDCLGEDLIKSALE